MKDTQGNPITEEDFMKDIGHGVGMQDWKEKLKEELYQFDVSSVQVTVLEYFIESLLSEARSDSYTNGYRDGYDEGRNAVLSEVEREVEKQELKSYSSKDVEVGFNYAKEVFSTIIKELRVK